MTRLLTCAVLLLLGSVLAGAQAAEKRLTCAGCHKEQALPQSETSMARALVSPAADPVLQAHPKLSFQEGAFASTIERRGDQSIYSVTDGASTVSTPIKWSFGAGAQTYLLEHEGHYYEGRLSYYPMIGGLDITVGDQVIHPANVNEAMGRELSPQELKACLGCHTTGSLRNGRLNLDSFTPGVRCAHCHVGAESHLEAISHGKLDSVPPSLKHLSAEDVSHFCGQCHRTWETVAQNSQMRGEIDVRFQPYRLANSKCFDGVDRRISCVGCHDPHREVVRDDASYDVKCLACHGAGAPRVASAKLVKSCTVAKSNCVSCHMPKIDLPGGHQQFTDHEIRIVRANEPYPN